MKCVVLFIRGAWFGGFLFFILWDWWGDGNRILSRGEVEVLVKVENG